MKLAFFVVSLGVVPTYMALEHFDWPWWLGYAILLAIVRVAYRLFASAKSETAAAFNIVMAQATLLTLDIVEKRKVETYAKHMYSVFEGDPDAVFENEFQKMAHIAMAMEDMEIDPVVLLKHWCDVPNPSDVPPAYIISKAMKMAEEKMRTATKSA